MRAIDADELKKCVLKWLPQDPCGKEEKEMPFGTDICVSMLMEIDEQPTIQPKRGKWVLVCDNNGMHFICDKCGAWRYHQEQNFCGECGADMREVTT